MTKFNALMKYLDEKHPKKTWGFVIALILFPFVFPEESHHKKNAEKNWQSQISRGNSIAENAMRNFSLDGQPIKNDIDSKIRRKMIKESINRYPGRCPCPFNSASNGSSCGGRSAYSRGGGYSVLCYPSDINSEMLKKYKENCKDCVDL